MEKNCHSEDQTAGIDSFKQVLKEEDCKKEGGDKVDHQHILSTDIAKEFRPGSFVAVASETFMFNIGEVVSTGQRLLMNKEKSRVVISVRWYRRLPSDPNIWCSPHLEDLLSATYIPIQHIDGEFRTGVIGEIGIMEILISFKSLNTDSTIDFSTRELIRRALEVYEVRSTDL